MDFLKKIFGGDLRQFGMVLALFVIMAFFQIASGGKALRPDNLINIIQGNSYILVLAVGMVFIIIAGHIDLSVGSVAGFVGIVVAKAMFESGWSPVAAVILGLVIGAVIGMWNGWWVAYAGIPGFIVTLAGWMIFKGAQQWYGKSLTVPTPKEFNYIGSGFLPEVGINTGYNNLTVLLGLLICLGLLVSGLRTRRNQRKIGVTPESMAVFGTRMALIIAVVMAVALVTASGRPGTSFPIAGIILAVLVVLYSFISTKTILGRHVYAVGGNKAAAALAGVKNKRVNFLVMMNMSILAALAGMMFVARSNASGPADGNGWELDAIAAVFIGGAAVSGGVGTVIGSIIGGLVMAVLNNGLFLIGIGADMQKVIKGLVLLLAVAFDVLNKMQGKPSIIGLLTADRSARTGSTTAPAAAAPVTTDETMPQVQDAATHPTSQS